MQSGTRRFAALNGRWVQLKARQRVAIWSQASPAIELRSIGELKQMRSTGAVLGHPVAVPCRACGYAILILMKPGRYALRCPECHAQTMIEIAIQMNSFHIR